MLFKPWVEARVLFVPIFVSTSLSPVFQWASPVALVIKNPLANAGDIKVGLIPGSVRSSGGGHGNPLQYSCLENLMDRRAWWAAVHRVAKSWTRLSNFSNSC